MRIFSILVAFSLMTGCGGSDRGDAGDSSVSPGMDAGHDAMTSMPDSMPSGPTPIGGACRKPSDCDVGATCLGALGNVSFPGGYCTKNCSTSNDTCGTGSFCLDLGVNGLSPFCVATCGGESDCRVSSYSCVFFGGRSACFPPIPEPNPDLCDPTMGDGTCTTSGHPGGCFRYRYGTGNSGLCNQSCLLGTGTCPSLDGTSPAEDGGTANQQHCVAFNEQNDGLGDKFVGSICLHITDNVAPNLECLSQDGNHYVDSCSDGYECDVQDPMIDPDGDNNCRRLCYPDGAPGDGGVVVPDGGMVAGGCNIAGQTCTRIFGNNVNMGVCIPLTPH